MKPYIRNKSNTERLLRVENHQILDKMREIKILVIFILF
jgi:hypothetical protein